MTTIMTNPTERQLLRGRQMAIMDITSALHNMGYSYTCCDIDFGQEGTLISPNGNLVVMWTFTGRDGIFAQVKRRNPHKILLEYDDGAWYINDRTEPAQDWLLTLKHNLDALRSDIILKNRAHTYERLQGVMLNAVFDHANAVK